MAGKNLPAVTTRVPIPHGLRILIETMGEEAAFRLVLARGGTRLRVPAKLARTGENTITQLVGLEAATKLIAAYGDCQLSIPLANKNLNEWMRGQNVSQLRRASTLRVSRRTIQSWDAGDGESLSEKLDEQ